MHRNGSHPVFSPELTPSRRSGRVLADELHHVLLWYAVDVHPIPVSVYCEDDVSSVRLRGSAAARLVSTGHVVNRYYLVMTYIVHAFNLARMNSE